MKAKYLGQLDLNNKKELKKRLGRSNPLTHISLFSGCGGLDCGFAQANIHSKVMIEFDKDACETLKLNFTWEKIKENKNKDGSPQFKNREDLIKASEGYHKKMKGLEEKDLDYIDRDVESWYHYPEPVIIERDIKEVTTKEILKAAKLQVGECSIISGGFPCQGFSLAGKRDDEDPRNFLYKEFVRIVDEAKPAMIFGENVPGLVSMQKGKVMKQICEDFANCGYDITWDILDAANYGVPQHRKRVILIGKRVDLFRVREDGSMAVHIAYQKGEITHPKLFHDRLKKWKKEEERKLKKDKGEQVTL